jgi:hypothetical protein
MSGLVIRHEPAERRSWAAYLVESRNGRSTVYARAFTRLGLRWAIWYRSSRDIRAEERSVGRRRRM